MSVSDPRPAAAQRTAASDARGTRRSIKVLATWMFIVPMLSFFSFSVVAGARTFDKPDYAGAIKQLPKNQPVVVVPAAPQDNNDGLLGSFEQQHFVCSVTASELARIQARYHTTRLTIGHGSHALDVVSVFGANERDLRSYLGDNGVRCVLVRLASVFFLPFDPHGS
jgi:hypothetical protein